ncbi:DUF262 domain-containing protein [Streptomyces sp. NRRL S-31]|uniref:DUF262 domain-containing protein n=1 Tax=Streptomyces sp. NRRL S-31 TaxID=1463898 RepID=UPI00131CD202|nr:DUF262 domain-containing protein [Streptomyces sp. NRRL S-31]
MGILEEVETSRQNIRSDGYTMSIGEVVNLYRDKEIQIRPEYQRLFRWPIEKQSRLIESILLDIPLPTIFVAQREDGVWEVVDGLQRLSTILSFMGELRDEATGATLPPSKLTRTKYLPSLEGMSYSGEEPRFSPELKIHFKRARLDFRILLRESDERVKYELFDRLNSGGVPTSPQEVRTAQLLMTNAEFYVWLDRLRTEGPFADCVPLTDRQISEQYDLELATRFFVLKNATPSELNRFSDMDTFLSDQILDMATSGDFDTAQQQVIFEGVFGVLSSLGPDVFRRYDVRREKPSGAFSVSAFEAITLGVAGHLDDWKNLRVDEQADRLRSAVSELWKDDQFRKYSGAGVRATSRVPMMPLVGNRIFSVD